MGPGEHKTLTFQVPLPPLVTSHNHHTLIIGGGGGKECHNENNIFVSLLQPPPSLITKIRFKIQVTTSLDLGTSAIIDKVWILY